MFSQAISAPRAVRPVQSRFDVCLPLVVSTAKPFKSPVRTGIPISPRACRSEDVRACPDLSLAAPRTPLDVPDERHDVSSRSATGTAHHGKHLFPVVGGPSEPAERWPGARR